MLFTKAMSDDRAYRLYKQLTDGQDAPEVRSAVDRYQSALLMPKWLIQEAGATVRFHEMARSVPTGRGSRGQHHEPDRAVTTARADLLAGRGQDDLPERRRVYGTKEPILTWEHWMPRTKPPDKEWKIVLARSGGVCAFPGCGESLTKPGTDQDEAAFIGEVAHIVSDSRQGPRGDVELSDEDRDKHPNLVLFCQNCHDRVDKQPRTFSVPVLNRIKEQHENRIAALASPAGPVDGVELKQERILSSLLPVTHLPRAVFAAPCGYGDHQDQVIKQHLNYPKDSDQIIRFLVREKTLFSFHDLRDPDGPFVPVIDLTKVEKYRSDEVLDDGGRSSPLRHAAQPSHVQVHRPTWPSVRSDPQAFLLPRAETRRRAVGRVPAL